MVEPPVAVDRPGAALPGPILEAVVFDLDGVLTDTASLHQSAWQRLFDELLRRYPSRPNLPRPTISAMWTGDAGRRRALRRTAVALLFLYVTILSMLA